MQNKLINQQQFGYEKIISVDSKMIFYTGLSSEQFNALWEFIEPELCTPIRKNISQKNELFAVLVKYTGCPKKNGVQLQISIIQR